MRALEGKVSLVTGSTSGIGLGIARKLAEEGSDVVLHGLDAPEKMEDTRKELASTYGVDVSYVRADVSKPDEIKSMMAQIKQQMGPVDILVNNAGIQKVSPIEEFPDEKWDAIMAVNLSSAFHTTKAAVPDMKEKGWGRIINIGSAHSQVASPFKTAYVASKFGLMGLSKSVALEVAENNITCNVVCPGYVKTPLVEGQIKDTAKARGISEEQVVRDVMLGEQPTKRFVSVEEVAATVAFLCMPGAASITGAALSVDGGWTAH